MISVISRSPCYFNSIKVQLEQNTPDEEDLNLSFQFHKGTIRTVNAANLQPVTTFQFHKGTIRTIMSEAVCITV